MATRGSLVMGALGEGCVCGVGVELLETIIFGYIYIYWIDENVIDNYWLD